MVRPRTNYDHGTPGMYNYHKCRCDLCRAWSSGYQRDRQTRNRDEWITTNGPCVTCGSLDRLEIDHIDGDRHPNWSGSFWTWSVARREKELQKCQVLCFACHRRKSGMEQRKPFSHGSLNGYSRHKCRCPKCRSYVAAYRANRRSEGKTP